MAKPRPVFLWLLGAVVLLAIWRRGDIMATLNILRRMAFKDNFMSGRTAKVDTIVIHTTEASLESAASWFSMDHKPSGMGPTSAHYIIGKDGKVVLSVDEKDTAYHAGDAKVNARSIGIELEGAASDPNAFTPAMMGALTVLTQALVQKYGIPVKRGAPGIIGHVDVDAARARGKVDPGVYFPWDSFLASVRAASTPVA